MREDVAIIVESFFNLEVNEVSHLKELLLVA